MEMDKVIGFDSIKRILNTKIRKIIDKKDKRSKFTGCLVYGTPGCGKTMFLEALLNDLIYPNELFIVKMIDKSNIAVGQINETAKKVNALFNTIKSDQDHIYVLVLDEAEDVFMTRTKAGAYASELTGSWLRNIGGINSPSNYFILAATNYYIRCDPAIVDRLSVKHRLHSPECLERYALIKIMIVDNFEICGFTDEWLKRWAQNSTGLSGRDFTHVQDRLDDREYENQIQDPDSLLTPVMISQEISSQKAMKINAVNASKDKDKGIWDDW